jgi:hypothetical protein
MTPNGPIGFPWRVRKPGMIVWYGRLPPATTLGCPGWTENPRSLLDSPGHWRHRTDRSGGGDSALVRPGLLIRSWAWPLTVLTARVLCVIFVLLNVYLVSLSLDRGGARLASTSRACLSAYYSLPSAFFEHATLFSGRARPRGCLPSALPPGSSVARGRWFGSASVTHFGPSPMLTRHDGLDHRQGLHHRCRFVRHRFACVGRLRRQLGGVGMQPRYEYRTRRR